MFNEEDGIKELQDVMASVDISDGETGVNNVETEKSTGASGEVEENRNKIKLRWKASCFLSGTHVAELIGYCLPCKKLENRGFWEKDGQRTCNPASDFHLKQFNHSFLHTEELHIKEAICELALALEHDKSGDYKESLKYYKKGLECLIHIMKGIKISEANKQILKTKCEQYMTRAETLQKKIRSEMQSTTEQLGATCADALGEKTTEKNCAPELLDNICIERPTLKLIDVAGRASVKDVLMEYIILPLKYPQFFTGCRSPDSSIMMYGAPGVGKTMLMRAVGGELEDVTYLRVCTYDFFNRFNGFQGERAVREVFTYAKQHAPCLLILDDFEGLFPDFGERLSDLTRRVKTEILVQFEAVHGHGVVVVCVTLAPWKVDCAVRKRLSKRIEVPMPSEEDRCEIFKLHFKDVKPVTEIVEQDFIEFATKTDGYTGADISVIVREAIMEPVRVLQQATHFKKILTEEDVKDSEIEDVRDSEMEDVKESEMVNIVEKFVMCSPEDPDAVRMAVIDIPSVDQLHVPQVTKEHVLKAIESSRPSLSSEDLQKLNEFTEQFASY